MVARKPDLSVPQKLLDMAKGSMRDRAQVRLDLERLLSHDAERTRGLVWAKHVLAVAGDGKSEKAKEWRAWATERGLRPPPERKAKKRRAPRRKRAAA